MRYFYLLACLGLSAALSAQGCITVTPVDTIFDTDNFASYRIVFDVRRAGGAAGNWIIASDLDNLNARPGSYGRVTLGPIPCGHDGAYLVGFFAENDPVGCRSADVDLFLPDFCGQGNCSHLPNSEPGPRSYGGPR